MSKRPARRAAQRSDRLATLGFAAAFLTLLGACSQTPPQSAPPPVMPIVQAPAQPPAPPVIVPPSPVPAPPPNIMAGHVASYKTLAEAEAAWPRLLERFPVLKDEPKRLVEIDLGQKRGKVVRLLIGGFVDRDHASQFCHKVRSSGAYCAPHELPSDKPGNTAS